MSDTCFQRRSFFYLCEFDSLSGSNPPDEEQQQYPQQEHQPKQQQQQQQHLIKLANLSISNHIFPFPSIRCPGNHWIPEFLACDPQSHCWADGDVFPPSNDDVITISTSSWCDAPNTPESLYFLCSTNSGRLPFTLVCDYRVDCFDKSDEDFCIHPLCPYDKATPCGDSGQCFHASGWCDMAGSSCKNSVDDGLCMYGMELMTYAILHSNSYSGYRPPTLIQFYSNQNDMASYHAFEPDSECPPTHFQCALVAYRLPVFVRCNGVFDCPYREDEEDCETYSCPGFFRCRQSRVCLHPDHVCDSRNQCPQQDDEYFCSLTCPDLCSCHGLAFTCRHVFPVNKYLDVRYLDASGSGLKAERLFTNSMLVYLSLKSCNLTELLLPELPNLKVLDVSYNQLEVVSLETLSNVTNLNHLVLTNNPLTSLFPSQSPKAVTFARVQIIDLSFVDMDHIDLSALHSFSGLTTLNLSGSRTHNVSGGRFLHPHLQVLDLRGSEMAEFPHDLLKDLSKLSRLYTDNFVLCCAQALPDHFNAEDCHAPAPVFSTCEHLLGVEGQRILLYVLTPIILLGNGFIVVLLLRERDGKETVQVFVSHLCGSKFLMGVYLCVLCVAEQAYSGSYLWEDTAWRSSSYCKVLAFLFLLSCQVAVFIEVSMTLEWCIVLTWPDKMGDQQTWKMTLLVCTLAWLAGVFLSLIPTAFSGSESSGTGLCVPLFFPGNQSGAHNYVFSLLVISNTCFMSLVMVGQTYIYTLVRANALAFLTNDVKVRDLTAARRVIIVAVTDACCWGLVTLWALMMSQKVWLSSDVISTISVFFIFVSAAVTPCLYLLTGALESRRQVQRQRVWQRLGLQVMSKARKV